MKGHRGRLARPGGLALVVSCLLLPAPRGFSAEGTRVEMHGAGPVGSTTSLPLKGASADGALSGRRGLRGEYFAGTMNLEHQERPGPPGEDGGGPALVRVDPVIDFDWGEGAPDEKVGANIFCIRWTGFLVAPASGRYVLHLTSDDGSRLWIDDELLIDNWGDHAMEEKSGHVDLDMGVAHRVRIEFYENMVYAGVKLEWSSADLKREVVPAGSLFGPEADFVPPVVATVAAGGGRRHRVGSKVKIVVSEERGEEGLEAELRITSRSAGYRSEVSKFHSLPDGVYLAEWDTAGLAPAADYAVEVTLTDAAGNSDRDGLPQTPDLVIALVPAPKMLSLRDPQDGPPRPGCVADGGGEARLYSGGAAMRMLLALALVACVAARLPAGPKFTRRGGSAPG